MAGFIGVWETKDEVPAEPMSERVAQKKCFGEL
jgi:hypothetical protein